MSLPPTFFAEMRKHAASVLRRNVHAISLPSGDHVFHLFGKPIAYANTRAGVLHGITIEPEYRGLGLGPKLLGELATREGAHVATGAKALHMGTSISDPAVSAARKAGRRPGVDFTLSSDAERVAKAPMPGAAMGEHHAGWVSHAGHVAALTYPAKAARPPLERTPISFRAAMSAVPKRGTRLGGARD